MYRALQVPVVSGILASFCNLLCCSLQQSCEAFMNECVMRGKFAEPALQSLRSA